MLRFRLHSFAGCSQSRPCKDHKVQERVAREVGGHERFGYMYHIWLYVKTWVVFFFCVVFASFLLWTSQILMNKWLVMISGSLFSTSKSQNRMWGWPGHWWVLVPTARWWTTRWKLSWQYVMKNMHLLHYMIVCVVWLLWMRHDKWAHGNSCVPLWVLVLFPKDTAIGMKLLTFIWIHLESVVATWHTRSDEFFNSDWFVIHQGLSLLHHAASWPLLGQVAVDLPVSMEGEPSETVEFWSRPVLIHDLLRTSPRYDNDIFWNRFPFVFSMNFLIS